MDVVLEDLSFDLLFISRLLLENGSENLTCFFTFLFCILLSSFRSIVFVFLISFCMLRIGLCFSPKVSRIFLFTTTCYSN